jgi:outer membrane lipoprotein SlyB
MNMKRIMDTNRGRAAGAILALTALLPAQQAAAQDPLAGAIVGGAVGGIIGGAVGRGAGGAVAGAVIGATAGTAIAAEAQQRHGGCYYRYPNGSWLQVQPGYCS